MSRRESVTGCLRPVDCGRFVATEEEGVAGRFVLVTFGDSHLLAVENGDDWSKEEEEEVGSRYREATSRLCGGGDEQRRSAIPTAVAS